MTITVEDVRTLIEVLETRPEWRDRFRLLVVDEVLQEVWNTLRRVTESVAELAEAQRRTEERVNALAEAQLRTEERLSRLEAVVAELAEAQRRAEERLERLEATVQALAEAQARTEQRLDALAEAQARTEERGRELTEAQRQFSEDLRRLGDTVLGLVQELRALVNWQRGEAGRREGEQYERLLIRRAPFLFNGGMGGSADEAFVRQWLAEKLASLLSEDMPEEANPFLADLIWWKGEQVIVVEASIQVNGYDVQRAQKRAETLRRAGLQAVGAVTGKEWAEWDTRWLAKESGVEWKVGDDVSGGWLAFRRLAAG